MKTNRLILTLSAALLMGLSATASADTKVLLCFPGGPGSTEQAQPLVDDFLAKLASLAGWDSASGAYYNDMKTCAGELKSGDAQVVMVPLDIYLAKRNAWKLSPAATLANKETASRYHLVARSGTDLESLKGKTVSTGIKADDAFLSRVAFDGKVDVAADFKLKRRRSALKAIKDLAKGKADAVLLDDVQQKALEGLPLAKDFVVVTSGPELPGAIVAGVGGSPDKLGESLLAICNEHQKICADIRVTGFRKVDSGRLTELEKQLKP